MKYLFFLCMVAISNHAFSQHYSDNWYFGYNCSLNFSSGSPIFSYSPMKAHEATASISDSSGNLLFFTNGESIWDKNGSIMPHGDSLEIGRQIGVPYREGSSVSQGVIIIPKPLDNKKYYVFYLANGLSPDPYSDLRLMYSVVDMNLNSGNGDVNPGQKNIPVEGSGDYMWESMTAVKHGNGRDWWLIALSGRLAEPDSFYFEKFLITADAISSPEFQFYDLWSSSIDALFTELGQMKFSPDGEKFANTMGSDVDIFTFDRCTGYFKNRITIDTVHAQTYGIEFSPDQSKLYVSTSGQLPNQPAIYQICLDCSPFIKTLLYKRPKGWDFGQLQVAPDGKIYTCFNKEGEFTDDTRYLSIINYPDSFGLSCDFDTSSFILGDSSNEYYGLPNMPYYSLGPLTGPDSCSTIIQPVINNISKSDIKIFPNPASNYVFLSDNTGHSLSFETLLFFSATGTLVKKILNPFQTIDVSELPPGIYLLKAIAKDQTFISRLEIMH